MVSSMHHQIPIAFSLSTATCLPMLDEMPYVVDDLSIRLLSLPRYESGIGMPEPNLQYVGGRGRVGGLLRNTEGNDDVKKKKEPIDIVETAWWWVGGRRFRATVELGIDVGAGGSMSRNEFEALIGLLRKTVLVVEEARGDPSVGLDKGIGSLGLKVEIEGARIDAWWTLWELVEGTVGRCR